MLVKSTVSLLPLIVITFPLALNVWSAAPPPPPPAPGSNFDVELFQTKTCPFEILPALTSLRLRILIACAADVGLIPKDIISLFASVVILIPVPLEIVKSSSNVSAPILVWPVTWMFEKPNEALPPDPDP